MSFFSIVPAIESIQGINGPKGPNRFYSATCCTITCWSFSPPAWFQISVALSVRVGQTRMPRDSLLFLLHISSAKPPLVLDDQVIAVDAIFSASSQQVHLSLVSKLSAPGRPFAAGQSLMSHPFRNSICPRTGFPHDRAIRP